MRPKTLQMILGHSNIAITMNISVHITEDEKMKEMLKFENAYKMAYKWRKIKIKIVETLINKGD